VVSSYTEQRCVWGRFRNVEKGNRIIQSLVSPLFNTVGGTAWTFSLLCFGAGSQRAQNLHEQIGAKYNKTALQIPYLCLTDTSLFTFVVTLAIGTPAVHLS